MWQSQLLTCDFHFDLIINFWLVLFQNTKVIFLKMIDWFIMSINLKNKRKSGFIVEIYKNQFS